MALDLSHLKDTGIARTVAKLRQHAYVEGKMNNCTGWFTHWGRWFWLVCRNDKVSIMAKNLRNAWMQLADTDKQPDNRELALISLKSWFS